MGNQLKKSNNQQVKNSITFDVTQCFQDWMKDDPNDITLTPMKDQLKLFWIDQRVHADQNIRNLRLISQNRNLQVLTSISQLKQKINKQNGNKTIIVISGTSFDEQIFNYMKQQRKISNIVIFSQNSKENIQIQRRILKVIGTGNTARQIIQILDKPIVSKNSVLFSSQGDIFFIDKYRINYHCLINHQNKYQAKEDLLRLAQEIYPQRIDTQIRQFRDNYILDLPEKQKNQQTINWIFRNSFYWDLISKLPIITNDLKKLVYLRLPFRDLHKAINQQYHQEGNQKLIKSIQTIYIVVEMTPDQQRKIKQNINNFIIFTTFVKGYTNLTNANKQWKQKRTTSYQFQVIIPKRSQLDKTVDLGYIIKETQQEDQSPNVIFNIYNFFQITSVAQSMNKASLRYGSVAKISECRKKQSGRDRLTPKMSKLMQSFDKFTVKKDKAKEQISALKYSGCYQDSINLSNLKLDQVRRTNKSIEVQDEIIIQKAEALHLIGQNEEAIAVYNSVASQKYKLMALLGKMDINRQNPQFTISEEEKEKIIEAVLKLKETQQLIAYHYKVRFYASLILMERKQYQQAKIKLKGLKNDIIGGQHFNAQEYDFFSEIQKLIDQCSVQINQQNRHEMRINE